MGNIKHVLNYLKGTHRLDTTLSVGEMLVIKWWVDASYTVYENCWGHTGSMMYLDKGELSSFSKKYKINGKISTEGDMIGVDESTEKILRPK